MRREKMYEAEKISKKTSRGKERGKELGTKK